MNIRVEDVTFSYPSGVLALKGVNLQIASGESVAILGENGAGKTTLVKQINRLLSPSSGSVSVGDWDTREHTVAQLARRVSFVFQNPDEQLFERTVRREVAFGPQNLGRSEEEVEARVQAALEDVGLGDQAEVHPYDLHASQRKLVALAAALAMDAPIMILDEPTTGQDAAGVAQVGAIVESLKAEGRTLITITHDVEFCAGHFERVIVMSEGSILADGPARRVLSQSGTLARAAVEAPQLIRLAQALDLPAAPLKVEDFLEAYTARSSS